MNVYVISAEIRTWNLFLIILQSAKEKSQLKYRSNSPIIFSSPEYQPISTYSSSSLTPKKQNLQLVHSSCSDSLFLQDSFCRHSSYSSLVMLSNCADRGSCCSFFSDNNKSSESRQLSLSTYQTLSRFLRILTHLLLTNNSEIMIIIFVQMWENWDYNSAKANNFWTVNKRENERIKHAWEHSLGWMISGINIWNICSEPGIAVFCGFVNIC